MTTTTRKRGRPLGGGRPKPPQTVMWSVKRIAGGRAKELGIVYALAHQHDEAVEEAYRKFGIIAQREKDRIFVERKS